MERAATFFGRAGEFTQNFYRWLILFLRRYPLAALAYLAIFLWYVFSFAAQPVAPPPPSPSAQYPTPAATPVSVVPLPTPTPAVSVAQAKAYQNGNSITIRWNQPVSQQQLIASGSSLTANCQPQICTATLPQQAYEVQASWRQGSEYFNTKFKV